MVNLRRISCRISESFSATREVLTYWIVVTSNCIPQLFEFQSHKSLNYMLFHENYNTYFIWSLSWMLSSLSAFNMLQKSLKPWKSLRSSFLFYFELVKSVFSQTNSKSRLYSTVFDFIRGHSIYN